ncbi:hypothetical protein CYMTET_8031 [Cymbomonas tetramitiformis]|uniref:Uncharacterized protein n=1 Tax=Cymbomonas tetramitiformis TaxID=36881 RepID=A0AAE0LGE3_9CHLO|nr:hypothetical protein CYMTET_8031 [Cymbomonas tetramitiformis]
MCTNKTCDVSPSFSWKDPVTFRVDIRGTDDASFRETILKIKSLADAALHLELLHAALASTFKAPPTVKHQAFMELKYIILLVAGSCLLLGSAIFAVCKYISGLSPHNFRGQRRASEVANPMFLMPQTPKSAKGSSPSSRKPETLPSAEVIIRTFLTPSDGQATHTRIPSSGSIIDDALSLYSNDSVPSTPGNANVLSSPGKAGELSTENRPLSQLQYSFCDSTTPGTQYPGLESVSPEQPLAPDSSIVNRFQQWSENGSQTFSVWNQNPIANARQTGKTSPENLKKASLAGEKDGQCGKPPAIKAMSYLDLEKPQVCF